MQLVGVGIDGPLAAPVCVAGGLLAARSAFRWARRRCEGALTAARAMPGPAERLYVLRPDIVPLSPELLRDQRALQQVLDRAVAARPVEAGA